jgi:hypothetical protein
LFTITWSEPDVLREVKERLIMALEAMSHVQLVLLEHLEGLFEIAPEPSREHVKGKVPCDTHAQALGRHCVKS